MGIVADTKTVPMLTVSWVNEAWREVFLAKSVRCRRLAGEVTGESKQQTEPPLNRERSIVICDLPDGNVKQLNEGDVYVMNENGRTVADYHLIREPYYQQLM